MFEVFSSECERISIVCVCEVNVQLCVCVRLIFSSMCARFNSQLCVCEVFSSECERISIVCM